MADQETIIMQQLMQYDAPRDDDPPNLDPTLESPPEPAPPPAPADSSTTTAPTTSTPKPKSKPKKKQKTTTITLPSTKAVADRSDHKIHAPWTAIQKAELRGAKKLIEALELDISDRALFRVFDVPRSTGQDILKSDEPPKKRGRKRKYMEEPVLNPDGTVALAAYSTKVQAQTPGKEQSQRQMTDELYREEDADPDADADADADADGEADAETTGIETAALAL